MIVPDELEVLQFKQRNGTSIPFPVAMHVSVKTSPPTILSSSLEIDRGLRILNLFGLDSVYDETSGLKTAADDIANLFLQPLND